MSEEVTAPGSRPGKGHRLTDHTSRTTPPSLHWRTVLPALGVSLSAFLLFGLQLPGWGHALLVVSLAAAWWADQELGKDLTLVGIGVAMVSTTSVAADVRWDRFFTIGTVHAVVVTSPLLAGRL